MPEWLMASFVVTFDYDEGSVGDNFDDNSYSGYHMNSREHCANTGYNRHANRKTILTQC